MCAVPDMMPGTAFVRVSCRKHFLGAEVASRMEIIEKNFLLDIERDFPRMTSKPG